MKNFIKEFKDFALKGNVMDMAVGIIVGSAFTSIVTALTDNILNPIISCIGTSEIGFKTPLGSTGNYIDWGAFISAVINFLIVAFVLFCILKAVNAAESRFDHPEDAPAAPPAKSDELLTLEEIRDLLKQR